MAGTVQQRAPLVLVLGIGVAVTSIPVISRIFHDLKILQINFLIELKFLNGRKKLEGFPVRSLIAY